MKKILLLALSLTILSCQEYKHKTKVYISNGHGWNDVSTESNCDSATMINRNQAILYTNGVKTVVYAENIIINTSSH